MKKKFSILLMSLGLVLLLAATAVLVFSQSEEQVALSASEALLMSLDTKIEENFNRPEEEKEETAMPIDEGITIDGETYLGILLLPQFSLNLPVAKTCSDGQLSLSPCVFSGSLAEENLIIVAHNYRVHFGEIHKLKSGDSISLIDTQGGSHYYRLATQELISENDLDGLLAGDWTLSLVTCLYGDNSRRTVLRFDSIYPQNE